MTFKKIFYATLLSIGAAIAPAQAGMGDHMGDGLFWTHNSSWMTAKKSGKTVTIRYDEPRKGLSQIGIAKGTLLFRGTTMSGNRLAGTAFAFKKGCQPASYNVSGKFTSRGEGAHTIVLRGDAPVRKGCDVVGYKPSSSNSKLVFRWAGTGD